VQSFWREPLEQKLSKNSLCATATVILLRMLTDNTSRKALVHAHIGVLSSNSIRWQQIYLKLVVTILKRVKPQAALPEFVNITHNPSPHKQKHLSLAISGGESWTEKHISSIYFTAETFMLQQLSSPFCPIFAFLAAS
jgi:hypothetical protein